MCQWNIMRTLCFQLWNFGLHSGLWVKCWCCWWRTFEQFWLYLSQRSISKGALTYCCKTGFIVTYPHGNYTACWENFNKHKLTRNEYFYSPSLIDEMTPSWRIPQIITHQSTEKKKPHSFLKLAVLLDIPFKFLVVQNSTLTENSGI